MRARTNPLGIFLLVSPFAAALNVAPIRPAKAPLFAKMGAARPPAGFEWGATDKPGALDKLDTEVVSRVLRFAAHAPAFGSLAYFGLISSTMMNMMTNVQMAAPVATLKAVITRGVGPTSQAAFSASFATLATPANFVFLIWPVISVLQAVTLLASALPFTGRAPLKQDTLTSLALANVFATLWLLASSNAMAGALPLASFVTLPFVPIFAGYPLRCPTPPRGLQKIVFSVYSSFTTLASILAFAVELQYGGRLPIVGKLPAEAAACIFAGLAGIVVAQPKRTITKKAVNLLALTGILTRRVALNGGSSILSLSFVALAACWALAAKRLVLSE